jgi:hypothetical protein
VAQSVLGSILDSDIAAVIMCRNGSCDGGFSSN